jgi:hypothetical protein
MTGRRFRRATSLFSSLPASSSCRWSLASVSLPHLLKNLELPPEPSRQENEEPARVAAAEVAIQAVEQAQHDMGEGRSDADLYTDPGVRIMELYRQRIDSRSKTGKEAALVRKIDEIERKLRLAGLRAERTEFYRMAWQASCLTKQPASWSERLICWSRGSARSEALPCWMFDHLVVEAHPRGPDAQATNSRRVHSITSYPLADVVIDDIDADEAAKPMTLGRGLRGAL